MGKNTNKSWGNKGKKNNAAANAKKILSGVVFMAACFLSVFVLMAYNDLIWLVAIMFVALMAAAYFFLGQIFANTEEEIDDLVRAQEALEAVKEEDRKEADAEFKRQVEEQMKSMDRTTRAMFMTMKKSAEAQAAQLANMETRIDKAIDEQNAGIKTIIKYNKENARQMALSEKDALEKLTDEIKAQNRTQPALQYVQMPMAQPVYQQPVMQEPVYSPAPAVSPVAEEPELPVMEEEPEVPEEFEVPEIVEEVTEEATTPEIVEEVAEEPEVPEEPEIPEEPAAVTSEADLAAATGVDLSDPNASLSADDIAKLFAAASAPAEAPADEATEEAAPEETAASDGLLSEDEIAAMLAGIGGDDEDAPELEIPEEPAAVTSEADLAAATGVDLSDPNASLSADDIAKLFAAAAGN